MIIRFLREIFKPRLKCLRLGHKRGTYRYKIRKFSFNWGEVCADYDCLRDECLRCGEPLTDFYKFEKTRSYTSVTMTKDVWDKLPEISERGFLVLKKRKL